MEVGEKQINYFVTLPPFTGRSVPIPEIAKETNKDASYIYSDLN